MAEIKSYRLFYLTAKLGSISKAAEACNMDRTAAGRRIKQLESHFDKKLLIRGTGGVELTSFGKEAFEKVGKILSLEDEMKTELSQNRNENKINILSSHSLISNIISFLVSDFIRENPGIRVDLVAEDIDSRKQSEKYDFCFYSVLKNDFSREVLEIATLKRSLYASDSYIKKYGHIKEINDLKNHKFIIFGSESDYKIALSSWPLYFVDDIDTSSAKHVVSSVNSVEAMVRMAESGIGAIGISDHIVKNLGSPLKNIASGVIENEYSLNMYYDNPTPDNIAAYKFIKYIQNNMVPKK